jgi:hypothetical protein
LEKLYVLIPLLNVNLHEKQKMGGGYLALTWHEEMLGEFREPELLDIWNLRNSVTGIWFMAAKYKSWVANAAYSSSVQSLLK